MKLKKTLGFSAIITFIRISSGFVAGKAIAVLTGPAGVALIGAFSNFITIALTFANGAINSGVVKYTAEYNDNPELLKKLFSTALKISFFCALFFGSILFGMAPFFSKWVFSTEIYATLIRVLGVAIIFYSLNTLLISILNGKSQIKAYTIVNTVGSLLALFLTIALVYFFKIQGALYALVLSQTIVFFVTVSLIIKSPWFSTAYFFQAFDKKIAVKLTQFGLMAIVSSLTIPTSQIILRNLIIAEFGVDAAGYWQGMLKVSDGYLMLITTSLGIYYLPKLSSLKTNMELKPELLKGFKLIVPTVFIGCIIIYFIRFFIIKTLYAESFMAMENLFLWQLIGDFFKMTAWILSYLMLSKAMTKTYVVTEIVFSLSYLLFSYLFMQYYGLIGVTVAFAVNYLMYLIVMVWIFRKILFDTERI